MLDYRAEPGHEKLILAARRDTWEPPQTCPLGD